MRVIVIYIADQRALRGVDQEEYEKWKIVKLLRISHSKNLIYLFFIGVRTGGGQGHPPHVYSADTLTIVLYCHTHILNVNV